MTFFNFLWVCQETKSIVRSLGAELFETCDDLCPRVGKGTDQCIALATAMVKNHPSKYFMPNQYENEANFLAHYETTGPEIWKQTNGKITHFIAGIGTGGTITGVGQYLKERNPSVKIIAVQPQKNHHIQGLRNLEESSMPKVLERRKEVIDEWVVVSDKDAFRWVKLVAEKEGLLIGPSSGAVLHAASQLAEKVDGKIVTIFADDGRKFSSLYKEFDVFTPEEFNALLVKVKHLPKNLIYEFI